MIVWTGEGTLLDSAGPHHTLTIQKNTYMTIQKQTNIVGHIGHKDIGYGTSIRWVSLEHQPCMKASKVLKRFDLNM